MIFTDERLSETELSHLTHQRNISMLLVFLMGMVPYIEYISVFRNIQARKLYLEELESAIYSSWAESQDVLHEVVRLRKTLTSRSDGASLNETDFVNERRVRNMHQVCHSERHQLSLNHQYYGISYLKKEWLNHIIYDKEHKILVRISKILFLEGSFLYIWVKIEHSRF